MVWKQESNSSLVFLLLKLLLSKLQGVFPGLHFAIQFFNLWKSLILSVGLQFWVLSLLVGFDKSALQELGKSPRMCRNSFRVKTAELPEVWFFGRSWLNVDILSESQCTYCRAKCMLYYCFTCVHSKNYCQYLLSFSLILYSILQDWPLCISLGTFAMTVMEATFWIARWNNV